MDLKAELPMQQDEAVAPPTVGVAPLGPHLPPFRRGGEQWSGGVRRLHHKSSSPAPEKWGEKKIGLINPAEMA